MDVLAEAYRHQIQQSNIQIETDPSKISKQNPAIINEQNENENAERNAFRNGSWVESIAMFGGLQTTVYEKQIFSRILYHFDYIREYTG